MVQKALEALHAEFGHNSCLILFADGSGEVRVNGDVFGAWTAEEPLERALTFLTGVVL